MKRSSLYKLIELSAAAAVQLQASDGSMPDGHNGPYHDPETPVRNTAHWLITFLKAYEISGERPFREASERAVAYLCSDAARPMGASFWHRKSPEKDSCNGLIGQAWTIEALALAARMLGDDRCSRLAESVFLLHPFDVDRGVWRRVSVDGSYLSVDGTFNHQLWFAASGALLLPAQDPRVEERVVRFMERLASNMTLYPSGLIRHPLAVVSRAEGLGLRARQCVTRTLRRASYKAAERAMHRKAIGYHAFNLYALALLKQSLPSHAFWQSPQLQRALAYVHTEEYVQGLEGNEYGYPYNPPGFEVAVALEVFIDQARSLQEWWVSQQLTRCYDLESHMMSRNTEDPATHAARLYEATRLPDMSISLELEGQP